MEMITRDDGVREMITEMKTLREVIVEKECWSEGDEGDEVETRWERERNTRLSQR